MYTCEAVSVEAFVQQVAVSYLGNGYWFYVSGYIPKSKDLWQVDEKLIERYEIDISKWTRCRRKKEGKANVQYIRFDRFFLTHGNAW